MSTNSHSFVAWEEYIVCHERGRRVVHFYLKDASGDSVLTVIGTERSIRHMMYVVSDEFVQDYGSKVSINACTKWRARRDVVEWLQSIVSSDSQINDLSQGFGSLEVSISARQSRLSDQMVQRKLKVQNSDIEWSGVAWICAKQLKHYPAFCRNGTIIAVHSFVFIMADEEIHYVGYVEDMYEDKKGQKKVKVRWFHHNQEVSSIIPELNPHPREVLITPHVQVISAECIDGLATVLTPRHYEKCVAAVPHNIPSGVLMCFRQFKNNKVKPFTLTKLRGYSNQVMLSSLDGLLASKPKIKRHNLNEEDNKEWMHDDLAGVRAKRSRSCKDQEGLHSGPGFRNSAPWNQITNSKWTYPKLKLRLSRKTMGIKFFLPQPPCPVSFKVDEKIEFLCQDSGIRGCWFRCKVLRASQKHLKVEYQDVQDVEGSGNLKEWVPTSRVAAPDKLGMRSPGRQVIRPCPPEDSTDCIFEVGASVDAWWCDGWWEGVVTGVDISGNDSLQVYLPGEDKFLTVQRKNLRSSKDWVGNRWVDIKTKTDILCYVSANAIPSMKLSTCSDVAEVSGCGSTASLEHKVFTTSRLEAVEEDGQELPISAISDDLRNAKDVNLRKHSRVDDENEFNKCTSDGGGDRGDDYVDDDDKEVELEEEEKYDDDDHVGDEAKRVPGEDLEFANQKGEVVASEVLS